MTAPGGGWTIERRAGPAHVLHEAWPAPSGRQRRAVALCTVDGPRALVLGSTQSPDVADLERAALGGVEVVHRGSGGGAVLVGPAEQVWLEAWIPRGDALWDEDVIRSSWWLGEAWERALAGLGARGLQVHRARVVHRDWSDVVCFAGVGPGEVTVGTAKAVGIAQRRTREGARLHCMAPLSWEPAALLELLALDPERFRGAYDAICDAGIGLRALLPAPWCDAPPHVVVPAVEDALLSAIF